VKTKFFKSAITNTIIVPVLTPDLVDKNWDLITADEIQKTAYEFILNLEKKSVNIDHEDGTDIEDAKFVESFIAPVDLNFWDWNIIVKGSWLVWIQLPEAIYKEALKWNFTAVSMEGWGVANEI